MDIFEASRIESLEFSKQKGFVLSDGTLTATVKGLLTDHNQGIDPNTGNPQNARNAHASIHEDELVDKGFTNKINGHTIVDGAAKYVIAQTLPNVTTGMIVCVLKDFK